MEAFLERIGEFGPYQARMFVLLLLPTVIVSMQKLAWVFLGARVDHRCQLPWEYDNATFPLEDEVFSVTIPWDPRKNQPHQCLIYSNITNEPLARYSNNTAVCEDHVYDTSKYSSSAVIDYELVCERLFLRAMVQSVYMFGMLIGSYLFGDLSDRFGRKPCFLSALVLMVIVGVGQAAIPNYYAFTATRFILGASLQGVFLVSYVMAMELVGKRRRVLVGVLAQVFYTVGFFTTALLAWSIESWKWLQVAMTLPALFFIPYYWIIPESARWLSTKGRTAEARIILEKAAKVNKKEVPAEFFDKALEPPSKEDSEGNFLDLFRTSNMRKKTFTLFYIWMVISGVYYGLSLNTGNLGGNDYINFIISAAVEIPAHIAVILLVDRIGRRLPICGFMVLGGISLLSTMFIPNDLQWLTITLAMSGKLFLTASYDIIYVFTAELFPTVVRNVGVGSSSMIARIGGALAPYINLLGDKWRPLPMLIFGGLSFAAGLLCLLLPETLNQQLPETIQDGENFGRKSDIKEDVDGELKTLTANAEKPPLQTPIEASTSDIQKCLIPQENGIDIKK